MSKIALYRDHKVGQRFHIRTKGETAAIGYLLKGVPGKRLVLERVSFSGYIGITDQPNDIANCQLVRTDQYGAPAVGVLSDDVTSASSTTVFETGLTMVLNTHAARWCFWKTGANAGTSQRVASNTVGGQITLATAAGTQPAAGEQFVLLPSNPADALWSATATAATLKTILPSWRLKSAANAQSCNDLILNLDLALPEGEGIGWFSTLYDNFTSTLDLVTFSEFCLNIEGRVEGAGYNANDYGMQFQPGFGI